MEDIERLSLADGVHRPTSPTSKVLKYSINAKCFSDALTIYCEAFAEFGGPFGAAVVRNGTLISCAHNMVLERCLTILSKELLGRQDPCCHAEMNAIQQACQAWECKSSENALRRLDHMIFPNASSTPPAPLAAPAMTLSKDIWR